jgi:hypothetical protein
MKNTAVYEKKQDPDKERLAEKSLPMLKSAEKEPDSRELF